MKEHLIISVLLVWKITIIHLLATVVLIAQPSTVFPKLTMKARKGTSYVFNGLLHQEMLIYN